MGAIKSGQTRTSWSPAGRRRGYPRIARVAVIVGTIASIVAMLAFWVERQFLTPNRWASTSVHMLDSAPVRTALSGYLVDQLYAHVDVARLAAGLPEPLGSLVDDAGATARNALTTTGAELLTTSAAHTGWKAANKEAAEALVAVVDGGHGAVSVGDTVTLDLRVLANSLGTKIGISDLGSVLPDSAARLVVLRDERLKTAQSIGRLVRPAVIAATILALILYLTAIAAAPSRRRMLAWVGVSMALAAGAVLILRTVVNHRAADWFGAAASVRSAVSDASAIGTRMLAHIAIGFGIAGLAIVAAAAVLSVIGRARAR